MVSMTHKNSNNSHKDDKRSKIPTPDFHSLDGEANGEGAETTKIRVGKIYQADVNPRVPNLPDPRSQSYAERALLVWAPNSGLSDKKVGEYVALAKDKYGYSPEQALGMLFWHNHDIDKAAKDLANFCPYREQWTVDDVVLFEQAFQFHGKNFTRIRQMLPEKTIPQLVKYYYLWKKNRHKTSHIDKQARKQLAKLEGNDSVASGMGGESETEEDLQKNEDVKVCSNCTVAATNLHDTPKGSQCVTCYNHWKLAGSLRPTVGPMKRDRQLIKHKRQPPKGMYINHEDLVTMSTASPDKSDVGQHILKHMDNEVVALKRQIQANKAHISTLQSTLPIKEVSQYKPSNPTLRLNAKWSHDELLLAVQGVRHFGRNFKAIAEVVGNKTENHVKSFFVTYRKRYSLDTLLKEWESEHGPTLDSNDIEMEEIKDNGASTSKRN